MLNTVGKQDREGAQVRCVVSVSMLTEGWDARTVTHIVGFRAFGTQLLCEQVTGRALRRIAYDSFQRADPDGRRRLTAEYADVVGIPFEFMPAADIPTPVPPTPKPRTRVHSVEGREGLRMVWPQVAEYLTRVEQVRFRLNPDRVTPFELADPWHPTMTVVSGVAGKEEIIGAGPSPGGQRTAHLRVAAHLVRRLETEETSGCCTRCRPDRSVPLGLPGGKRLGDPSRSRLPSPLFGACRLRGHRRSLQLYPRRLRLRHRPGTPFRPPGPTRRPAGHRQDRFRNHPRTHPRDGALRTLPRGVPLPQP